MGGLSVLTVLLLFPPEALLLELTSSQELVEYRKDPLMELEDEDREEDELEPEVCPSSSQSTPDSRLDSSLFSFSFFFFLTAEV